MYVVKLSKVLHNLALNKKFEQSVLMEMASMHQFYRN